MTKTAPSNSTNQSHAEADGGNSLVRFWRPREAPRECGAPDAQRPSLHMRPRWSARQEKLGLEMLISALLLMPVYGDNYLRDFTKTEFRRSKRLVALLPQELAQIERLNIHE